MAVFMVCGCNSSDIIYVKNGMFTDGNRGGQYFIGTNFWYGAILGSEGEGGDRARLAEELDALNSIGVSNLRVLVGGDGPDGSRRGKRRRAGSRGRVRPAGTGRREHAPDGQPGLCP